jgi:hypothetical protein
MKKLLLFACLLAACKKPINERVPTNTTTAGPSVTAVKFFPVYSGANASVEFDVDLVSDSATVSKVDLYLSPNSLRWEVLKPVTGAYKMYDHVGDYPTYTDGYFYFFTFVKKDGTVINTKPFQVY